MLAVQVTSATASSRVASPHVDDGGRCVTIVRYAVKIFTRPHVRPRRAAAHTARCTVMCKAYRKQVYNSLDGYRWHSVARTTAVGRADWFTGRLACLCDVRHCQGMSTSADDFPQPNPTIPVKPYHTFHFPCVPPTSLNAVNLSFSCSKSAVRAW